MTNEELEQGKALVAQINEYQKDIDDVDAIIDEINSITQEEYDAQLRSTKVFSLKGSTTLKSVQFEDRDLTLSVLNLIKTDIETKQTASEAAFAAL